ncbi:MAG TPA: T9SS type A sorting domain-containing protein [Bacteroidetes bacterium]|nr:hypothetical protein BMS3Bbin04_01015 [bacterium BMS3Bbin04]HDO66397.1 T9SS type A sorting domain-containing protein [Bacteroidota bacterium]HEX05522.1 T9SS type A sorting domain-containing protein [Bacteroidota bacterium]
MNRMFAHVLVVLMLLFAVSAYAQVVFGPTDIPATPGTVTEYYSEPDIEVDLGGSGADQFWDFTEGSTASLQTEEIFEPETTPYYNIFPTSNRVTFGPVPFGLDDGTSWRYDQITDSQWTIQGITLDVAELGGEFPFPVSIPLMELPLEYGNSWGINIYREMTIDVDDIPYPIPLFDEIRIEVTIQGSNVCDSWGTVAVPGDELDALRVYTQIGGYADAVGIYYIFNIPIEVPLGRVYELNAVKAYSWYSPGHGEVVIAMSNPDEPDPNFTQASMVRRINLGETAPTLTLVATPDVEPIEIPAQGGVFGWSVSVTSTYPMALPGNVWTTAILPNGYEYNVQNVPVTIPANGGINAANLSQAVPGFAPSGNYTFNVYAGLYPNLVAAQDSFPFTKLAAATTGEQVGGWNDCTGIGQLSGTQLAGDSNAAVIVSDFALSEAYPNPFNPETSLTLTLPQTANADVIVYNTMGRQVAVLNQGALPAGQHNLVFDGSNLSSGVYFVSATVAGQSVQIQKIMLMK